MVQLCSACGLPPILNKPLLKCTRCQQAFYHDRRCQQDHYPKHKIECRRFAKKNTSTATVTISSSITTTAARKSLVECRQIEGRGRSLFATSSLLAGCHPLPSNNGTCEAIAHPVLLASMRQSRCAYCFQKIHNNNILPPSKLHYHCSHKCKSLDTNWQMETHAMNKLPSLPSPTALSISRILRKFIEYPPVALEQYNELCYYDIDLLSEKERETYLSILNQCHIFLRAMEHNAAAKLVYDMIQQHDKTLAYQFMSRLSMNGFTISNSEQHAIGHGVYIGASMINHSCRSNAVPTFWLRNGEPPALQVTLCKDVSLGNEITISYCDVTTPTCMRKESLYENYKFVCDCALCKDVDRDDKIVGLKCSNANNGTCMMGSVKSIAVESGCQELASEEEQGRRYRCNSCGNCDFDTALKEQSDSVETLKRLESAITMNTSTPQQFDSKLGDRIRKVYDRLKRYCCLQSSYYLAWSADLLVCWCANALKYMSNEQEQMRICHEALVVINESRSATQFCMKYSGSLSWHIKQGMEAKLRLFINPMDMQALKLLKNTRKEFLMNYPSTDEMILSLEESLAVYSFS